MDNNSDMKETKNKFEKFNLAILELAKDMSFLARFQRASDQKSQLSTQINSKINFTMTNNPCVYIYKFIN